MSMTNEGEIRIKDDLFPENIQGSIFNVSKDTLAIESMFCSHCICREKKYARLIFKHNEVTVRC